MPIPKPNSGESEQEFVSRCIGEISGEYDQQQAAAICYNTFRESKASAIQDYYKKVEQKIKTIIKNESYSDYPDGVKNNAKRVLDWTEKNGWGSCGTDVGKQRANQLAKGEPISVETIKRMYSYLSRHEVDLESSTSYSDGCGKLMYDSWGGKAALGWSRNKLRELGQLNED